MRRIAVLTIVTAVLAATLFVPLQPAAGCFGRRSFRRVVVIQQPQAFYQVGSQLRQSANEEAIARRTAQLLLEALLKAGQGGSQGLRLSKDAEATGIISNSCLKCHSGATLKGGLDLSKDLTPLKKMRAALRVVNRTMPPAEGGGPLSDAKTEAIVTWSLLK